jgi:endonuclease III-like uncharacterized protein
MMTPHFEDLIISVLSVSRCPVDKTFKSADALRDCGLFNPANIMDWDTSEIATKLQEAGLGRGDYMNKLLAIRLSAVGQFIREVGIIRFHEILRSKDKTYIRDCLIHVKGIGPSVLNNFFLLRGIL